METRGPEAKTFIATYKHPKTACVRAEKGEFRNIISTYVHGYSPNETKEALMDQGGVNCDQCGVAYDLKSVQHT